MWFFLQRTDWLISTLTSSTRRRRVSARMMTSCSTRQRRACTAALRTRKETGSEFASAPARSNSFACARYRSLEVCGTLKTSTRNPVFVTLTVGYGMKLIYWCFRSDPCINATPSGGEHYKFRVVGLTRRFRSEECVVSPAVFFFCFFFNPEFASGVGRGGNWTP